MAREDLDEDRLAEDPLERGMEPPERPTAATRPDDGNQDVVGQRLDQEEPDIAPQPGSDDAPVTRPFENHGELPELATGTPNQSADQAGGSVADAVREPGPAD